MHSRERLKKASPNKNRLFRYRWALQNIHDGDRILEGGCGSGFGREFFTANRRTIQYTGIDYTEEAEPDIIADLNLFQPRDPFDVFVGFESIEHVKNTENYVKMAKKAKRDIFITCPASETISWNPHHVHDFSVPEIFSLFEDEVWKTQEHFLRIVKRGKVIQQCWRFRHVSVLKYEETAKEEVERITNPFPYPLTAPAPAI